MFSVIIPLYNKAPYIQRALDSVLNQSFKDYEIIVVNDGSTDGGEEIVSKVYGDKVKLIHQNNQGVSAARNTGITVAHFDYIAFLDADDSWHPDYLLFVSTVIKRNRDVGIIGCHYDPYQLEINPVLNYFSLDQYFKRAKRNVGFFTSATVIKKVFFDTNPGFDPQLKLGEDIDVWLRASLFFGDGIYIQNTLVFYGQEDDYRATQKNHHIENSLIFKIINPDYYSSAIKDSDCTESEFINFRDAWVYMSLYQYYPLDSNLDSIQDMLKQMQSRYMLVRACYQLPFFTLQWFFRNKNFSNLFRNYMKFCFRYIYR
ncbi:glycosyltransferase family 2 protein [Algoriphagus sp. AGSA1]|uniref:glycosyltransferase family 2 protein n=1 Tax=Algoriphagus sp. AGSA1 TaxID=2907213 RepID=UPI001F3DD58D|nr:glycosyltransferase family A protein [Algoriphagus sp. AGSA1]MCE7054131.1 glycosyltransferase family 2 protein [Algoriphagus sp. AGSA1]